MSEQMFNIVPQFHVKLTLPLLFSSEDVYVLYLSFRLASVPLRASTSPVVSFRTRKGIALTRSFRFPSVALHLCASALRFSLSAGDKLPHSRRAMPITPQRRHPRLLSPRLCHYGGCSHVCRRFLWRKIRSSVAVPALPAVHFGDNFAIDRQLYFLNSELSVALSLRCTLYYFCGVEARLINEPFRITSRVGRLGSAMR
jgi:hypothetical protein